MSNEHIKEYLGNEDWRIKANANQGYSIGGLILNVAGKDQANYWMDEVLPDYCGQAHREGDFHIHDLDMLAGYCAGWSLKNLLREGLNGVPGKVNSAPPAHFGSALGQMVNFFGCLQNEWAGAQAFSSFDTLLAPYVHKDGLSFPEIKKHIKQFVFNVNQGSRWGSQSPFTNLTFDLACPEDMANEIVLIRGEEYGTYGDYAREMYLINKAFVDVMSEGDATGQPFTFPIPTYNITNDLDWDSPLIDAVFSLAAKMGSPYFQNFISSDVDPKQIRSMCCRLQLDLTQLEHKGNGLFGSGDQTGSIGVVTLNCARLGYKYGDMDAVKEATTTLVSHAVDVLESKRKFLQARLDAGLYPYTKRYLGTWKNHFSTIGVNGIHEMLLNLGVTGTDTEEGAEIAADFLDHLRDQLKQAQEQTGNMYNLEATPAEGATYRFAREDYKRYGASIIQAGKYPDMYYTNSSQLPVDFGNDPFEALELQDVLQKKYTGGTVVHAFLGENIGSVGAAKFVKQAFTKFKLPYLTLTPVFSVCPTHGHIEGEHERCPECGQSCEVWSRVMGYYRPKNTYNIGKKKEADSRVNFVVDKG